MVTDERALLMVLSSPSHTSNLLMYRGNFFPAIDFIGTGVYILCAVRQSQKLKQITTEQAFKEQLCQVFRETSVKDGTKP